MFMAFKFILLTICLTVFGTVKGCGQIHPGREKTVNFTVTDFKLPAVMAFSEDAMERMKVPTISASTGDAQTFVRRLIMRPVEDVLYQQGRSAFLPDSVISSILQQLEVQITYAPLKCEAIVTDPTMQNMNGAMGGNKINCVIVSDTVTNICSDPGNGDMCSMAANLPMNSKPIPSTHLSISGSLKTSNAIMANWSSQMWQNVLNRVLRMITAGQYGSYFFGASVNLS